MSIVKPKERPTKLTDNHITNVKTEIVFNKYAQNKKNCYFRRQPIR